MNTSIARLRWIIRYTEKILSYQIDINSSEDRLNCLVARCCHEYKVNDDG